MRSLVGQVVNFRYEILEKTGEGSLFTVYRTRDKVMNRMTAIKVLRPDYCDGSNLPSRLLDRARKLIPINHPNVTRVLEAEQTDEGVYVSEEHVRGIDLKERIRRIAPFTVASAVDVSVAVAQGLDHLHRNGIVHGDLRPHKVLVGPEGEVKVTGAGLAFAFSEQEDKRTLALMRAAHYASPEAFEGRLPDERSDIYALGVIMFEMLTATLPFTADSPIGVAMKHAAEPVPSPRAINAGIPRTMEGIILKALAKKPEERYQTARELLVDLRGVQESLRVGKTLSWAPAEGSAVQGAADAVETRSEESLLKSLAKAGLLVALVALVVFAGITALVRTTPADVSVPSVVGMDLDEAQAALAEAELRSHVEREEYNDSYDEGKVFFSQPQGGTSAKKGTTVELYVSSGPRDVQVPSLVGLTEDQSKEVLNNWDLVLGSPEYDFSEAVAIGKVIRQSPGAGTSVRRGSTTVDIVLSKGPREPPPAPEPEPEPPEYQPPAPDTQPDTAPGGGASALEPRTLRVKFALPQGPARRVQILVKDDNGQWTALDENYKGGANVSATFTATGKSVEIRTLLDGKEVNKQVR